MTACGRNRDVLRQTHRTRESAGMKKVALGGRTPPLAITQAKISVVFGP
jgi:hypothetical protein